MQTPYEQWLPDVYPISIGANTLPKRFTDARDAWFGDPASYANAMYNGQEDLLPNFIHLESLGPKSDEDSLIPNIPSGANDLLPPIRKVVSSTLADADGDGFTDSFWFVLPGVSEDGIRQVAAVSIIDNASMVDVNTATRFDRWSTAGHTPADIALTSRLSFNPYQPDGEGPFDVTDTLTGLLSDPQNSGMHGGFYPGPGPFWAATAEGFGSGNMDTAFWAPRFDGIFNELEGESGWTEEVGVTANGDFVLPYRTPLFDFTDGPIDLDVENGPTGSDVAQLDRRRYFQRSNFGAVPSLDRYNDSGVPEEDPTAWGIINAPTREFGNADELELRMFASNGFGPVISRLERTIERPWGIEDSSDRYRFNPLRSSLTRAENVARPLGQVVRGGHQLDARELMFDLRHRMTTYSATRNDLVPLHQRPTPFYVPGWKDPTAPAGSTHDYAFGRILNRFTRDDVLNAENQLNDPSLPQEPWMEPLREFSRASYAERGKKLDLRAALDGPFTKYESLLYSDDPSNAGFPLFPSANFAPVLRYLNDGGANYLSKVREGLWPGQAAGPGISTVNFKNAIAIDREIRFRQRLESVLASELASSFPATDGTGGLEYQSYLQDQYRPLNSELDLIEYARSRDMAASWAANIDCYRDSRRRVRVEVPNPNVTGPGGGPTLEGISIDQPIWWQDAPLVPSAPDPGTRFVGMEPQPFLMEAFFATVYPSSFADNATRATLEAAPASYPGELDDIPGSREIPGEFPHAPERWIDEKSLPAIVFAIQVANPYDVPVPLHDLEVKIGDNNATLKFALMPSPHPTTLQGRKFYNPSELYLGPTLPDQPRTAIIFGVIPPDGTARDLEGFEPAAVENANWTPGWEDRISFKDQFGMPFEEFRWRWMDFLDIEPGVLFGWEPDSPLENHQTLVFDASTTVFPLLPTRSSDLSGSGDLHDVQLLSSAINNFDGAVTGLSDDLGKFFDSSDRTVELIRTLYDPVTGNAKKMVIDRFDDPNGSNNPLADAFVRMTQIDDDVKAVTRVPEYTTLRKEWFGWRLGGDDMAVAWVRAGRAWGWDVNGNSQFDLSEVSPRYVFSELPPDLDMSNERSGDPLRSDDSTSPGVSENTEETLRTVPWDLAEDPDGRPGASPPVDPWMSRTYIPSLFPGAPDQQIRYGKPAFFSTATKLLPNVVTPQDTRIDFDAGFPVLWEENLGLREVDNSPGNSSTYSGWPTKPWDVEGEGESFWALMDKGQENVDAVSVAGIPWIRKERWIAPLQMAHKNGDIEQVGEILNAFLWGHVADFDVAGQQAKTIVTFSEIMNNTLPDVSDASGPRYPVVRREIDQKEFDFEELLEEELVEGSLWSDTSLVFLNRYQPDQGRLNGLAGNDSSVLDGFRPNTPVLSGRSIDEIWRPALPAGTAIFDALVCDGPGSNHTFDITDNGRDVNDQLFFNEESFSNAAGFSGRPTRGLLNLNTASPEVLRTLPQMSRLIYNDQDGWRGLNGFDYPPLRGSGQLTGESELSSGGEPAVILDNEQSWVRVPEAIDRYRSGAGPFARANPRLGSEDPYFLPAYLDRGNLDELQLGEPLVASLYPEGIPVTDALPPNAFAQPGFFPGMRRGVGMASIGELLLLQRPLRTAEGLVKERSDSSIFGLLGDPFTRESLGSRGWFSGQPDRSQLGLGWRQNQNNLLAQADARLSTDRVNTRLFPTNLNPLLPDEPQEYQVELPDSVAGDAEEAFLLFSGMSNLVSVRSDTFTAYLKIRSFKQNPVTGVWNAMNPEYVLDETRYVFQIDRSNCERPSDTPQIRMLNKVLLVQGLTPAN